MGRARDDVVVDVAFAEIVLCQNQHLAKCRWPLDLGTHRGARWSRHTQKFLKKVAQPPDMSNDRLQIEASSVNLQDGSE